MTKPFPEINTIRKHLSDNVIQLLDQLSSKGYQLCLVGGVVRDFLLSKNKLADIDCEVQGSFEDDFEIFWKGFKRDLKKTTSFHYEKLPFNIIRVKMDRYELEFTPARKEKFEEQQKHKNFTAYFYTQFPYEECFLRRDFTINSIGILWEQKNLKLIDPFNGVADLQSKILKTHNPNFSKDPVRYLRAIRFHLYFKYDFSKDLLVQLKQMQGKGASNFHLFSEMLKSRRPFEFVKIHLNFTGLKISDDWGSWDEQYQKLELNYPKQGLFYLYIVHKEKLPPEFCQLMDESLLLTGQWKKLAKIFQNFHKVGQGSMSLKQFVQEYFQWNLPNKQDLLQNLEKLTNEKILALIKGYDDE
jgi:tRNA nucleotidyltransferase (CCA-adding enzyme)